MYTIYKDGIHQTNAS